MLAVYKCRFHTCSDHARANASSSMNALLKSDCPRSDGARIALSRVISQTLSSDNHTVTVLES